MAVQITDEKEDFDFKLSIEIPLVISLVELFVSFAVDVANIFSLTGQLLNAESVRPELNNILAESYSLGKKAGTEIREKVEIDFGVAGEQRVGKDIESSLNVFSSVSPSLRSQVITDTTNRKLELFKIQSQTQAIEEGTGFNNTEIGEKISDKIIAHSTGRSRNIAITETLNAVEGSRVIEANELSDSGVKVKIGNSFDSLENVLGRMWWTREDDHVRPTHVKAHGQKVIGTTQPFQVGNSLLMYPGDTSLGADISEISGCRCFAATFIG